MRYTDCVRRDAGRLFVSTAFPQIRNPSSTHDSFPTGKRLYHLLYPSARASGSEDTNCSLRVLLTHIPMNQPWHTRIEISQLPLTPGTTLLKLTALEVLVGRSLPIRPEPAYRSHSSLVNDNAPCITKRRLVPCTSLVGRSR